MTLFSLVQMAAVEEAKTVMYLASYDRLIYVPHLPGAYNPLQPFC